MKNLDKNQPVMMVGGDKDCDRISTGRDAAWALSQNWQPRGDWEVRQESVSDEIQHSWLKRGD